MSGNHRRIGDRSRLDRSRLDRYELESGTSRFAVVYETIPRGFCRPTTCTGSVSRTSETRIRATRIRSRVQTCACGRESTSPFDDINRTTSKAHDRLEERCCARLAATTRGNGLQQRRDSQRGIGRGGHEPATFHGKLRDFATGRFTRHSP